MKKWLFPIIAGSLVLALGVTFTRSIHSRRAAVAAEQAAVNDVQRAQAAIRASDAVSADVSRSGDRSERDTLKPRTTPDGQIVYEKATPGLPAGDAAPVGIENAPADASVLSPQLAADGADAAAPENEQPRMVVTYRVLHLDAAELRKSVEQMLPKRFGRISVDTRTNSLIVMGDETAHRDFKKALNSLDQPGPNTDEQSPKILIVPVQNRDAASLLELVKRMHPKGEEIYADSRTNSLIFPNGVEPKYLDILRELDQPEAKRKNNGPVAGADGLNSLTELPIVGRLFASNQAPSGGLTGPAAREYQQFEAQCLALAAACREQQAAAPQDAKRFEQLKNELQGAVHSAFHARQSWQRTQAAQLRTRLEQIERRISERSQMSNEIIQRRMDELLNPQKQWDASDNADPTGRNASAAVDPLDRPAADAPRHNRARQATAGPKGGSSNVDGPPLEGSTAAESSPARETAQRALRQSARDPRQELLDAEAAVDESRAALVNSKAIFQWAESISKKSQDLLSKGQVTESEARSSAAGADAKKADWQRAEKVYEIAERRLKSAREAFALEIKFLEYDLSDAKARMDHAAIELAGTERLYKQNIVSRDEYESKKLPQQLAASQYERAKMLLDLYQKSQPDKKPFLDQTRPAEVPDDPSNEWGADKSPKKIELNLPAAADDPRQRVRDVAHAIAAARAAVAEAEANVAGPEQELKRMQTVAPGVIPQREVLRIERSLASARAALQSRRVDLEIREQQFEEAREMLAERIKLLEIELADAKLRLEEAESKFSQASQLLKKGAIANEQYEKIRVARGLAESQYQRAQLLVDQYRKALPGDAASAANDPSAREKPYKGVWLSDFAAAQDQAAKTHRPIVVFYFARQVIPCQKMKIEVLGNDAVIQAVGKRFIGVIVDVDAHPEVKNYNLPQLPSIRILREDGELLGRQDGSCTADYLLNLLNESLARLKYAPRSNSSSTAEEKPGLPQSGDNKPAADEKPNESESKPGKQSDVKPDK